MAAGQAGAALHKMAVLRTYQDDLLEGLDQGQDLPPEVVTELHLTTDLALCATKQTMAAMVSMEKLQWVNLGETFSLIHRFQHLH